MMQTKKTVNVVKRVGSGKRNQTKRKGNKMVKVSRSGRTMKRVSRKGMNGRNGRKGMTKKQVGGVRGQDKNYFFIQVGNIFKRKKKIRLTIKKNSDNIMLSDLIKPIIEQTNDKTTLTFKLKDIKFTLNGSSGGVFNLSDPKDLESLTNLNFLLYNDFKITIVKKYNRVYGNNSEFSYTITNLTNQKQKDYSLGNIVNYDNFINKIINSIIKDIEYIKNIPKTGTNPGTESVSENSTELGTNPETKFGFNNITNI